MSKTNWLRSITPLFLGLLIVSPIQAQDAEPTFVTVDCMKSTSSDYVDLETEIYKPIHQAQVDAGRKQSWALYWVLFGDRSECDYYTVNVQTGSQMNAEGGGFAAFFEQVHPDLDMDEVSADTWASRDMVWTRQWRIVDMVPPTDFTYVQVNEMLADDGTEYIAMERETYKPVHEALVADGVTAGWGVYQLVSPHGSSMGFNYGTADFLNSLGGVDWNTYMAKAHPGKDVAALADAAEDTRELVSSETWLLLQRTDPPK